MAEVAGPIWTITSEDAARLLTPNEGWNAPSLTEEQKDELVVLIRPALDAVAAARFRVFIDRVFATAVERYVAFRGVVPRSIAREQVAEAVHELRHAPSYSEGEISPAIQGLIEEVLDRESPPSTHEGLTAVSWLAALPIEDRRTIQARALASVAVEVKRGPSNVIDRLMVRGLAALIGDLTGENPHRTVRHSDEEQGPTGEYYWFLHLAQELARFVHDALPSDLRRPGTPPLTGIVREELEALEPVSSSAESQLPTG